MDRIIENLSNVFTTLGDIKISAKESYAMYMCMKTLEDSIVSLSKLKQDELNNELNNE